MVNRFRLRPLHNLVGFGTFQGYCKKVHQFSKEAVKEAVNSRSCSPFIEMVRNGTMDENELYDHITNLLVAGRDATACLLSWCL